MQVLTPQFVLLVSINRQNNSILLTWTERLSGVEQRMEIETLISQTVTNTNTKSTSNWEDEKDRLVDSQTLHNNVIERQPYTTSYQHLHMKRSTNGSTSVTVPDKTAVVRDCPVHRLAPNCVDCVVQRRKSLPPPTAWRWRTLAHHHCHLGVWSGTGNWRKERKRRRKETEEEQIEHHTGSQTWTAEEPGVLKVFHRHYRLLHICQQHRIAGAPISSLWSYARVSRRATPYIVNV